MARVVQQAAAIPVYDGRVCLVTSRNGRRWVLPKGGVDAGHTPQQAAAVEAWEEAGLVGEVAAESVGAYDYVKYGLTHRVQVFVMRVSDRKKDWPEKGERRREWVTAEEAIDRVAEGDLRDILRAVLLSEGQPAGA